MTEGIRSESSLDCERREEKLINDPENMTLWRMTKTSLQKMIYRRGNTRDTKVGEAPKRESVRVPEFENEFVPFPEVKSRATALIKA